MILNCPNCIAQFYIEDDILGASGRKVKCSSCGVTWMQAPKRDDESDDYDFDPKSKGDSFDPSDVATDDSITDDTADVDFVDNGENEDDIEINEALERAIESLEQGIENEDSSTEDEGEAYMPTPSEDDGYRPSGFTSGLEAGMKREQKVYGYVSAACVFLVLLCGLLISSSSILSSYPSAQAFYGWFGIGAEIPGKNLDFHEVEVVNDGNVTHISGKVVNFGNENIHVPPIIAVIKDSHEEIVAEHFIYPSQDNVPEQGVIGFKEEILDSHLSMKDAYSLTLRFAMDYEVAVAKTVVVNDGNNQAHHQDGSDHQSVHEESEGSHPPASSDAHPEPSHQSPHSSH